MADNASNPTINPKVEYELNQSANPDCKKCFGRGYTGLLKGLNGEKMIRKCKCTLNYVPDFEKKFYNLNFFK